MFLVYRIQASVLLAPKETPLPETDQKTEILTTDDQGKQTAVPQNPDPPGVTRHRVQEPPFETLEELAQRICELAERHPESGIGHDLAALSPADFYGIYLHLRKLDGD